VGTGCNEQHRTLPQSSNPGELCILLEMNVESERRQLVFLVKIARTPEKIRNLEGTVKGWLKEWPEDVVIQRTARELANKEAWLKKNGQWP
jgi:hypothetical protein